uniref:Uncharacterized protein n=1 Tax=Glossina austeni TaxID=7395 RepID=A0A1A9V5G0_GLOAU
MLDLTRQTAIAIIYAPPAADKKVSGHLRYPKPLGRRRHGKVPDAWFAILLTVPLGVRIVPAAGRFGGFAGLEAEESPSLFHLQPILGFAFSKVARVFIKCLHAPSKLMPLLIRAWRRRWAAPLTPCFLSQPSLLSSLCRSGVPTKVASEDLTPTFSPSCAPQSESLSERFRPREKPTNTPQPT